MFSKLTCAPSEREQREWEGRERIFESVRKFSRQGIAGREMIILPWHSSNISKVSGDRRIKTKIQNYESLLGRVGSLGFRARD